MDYDGSHVTVEALAVLDKFQKRDYKHLGTQMDMQKDEIVTDLSFARLALTIPEDHYEVLTIAFPLLQNSDAKIKSLEWKRIMAMDFMLPYKVNSKQRAM